MIAEILKSSIKSCTEYSVSANCHIKLHRTHRQNRLLDNILKGCFLEKLVLLKIFIQKPICSMAIN